MKIKLEFKKQDAWLGVFWNPMNIWICLIPCFPIHIYRQTICSYCAKRIKGDHRGFGYHNDKKWIKYSDYSNELVTCQEAATIDRQVDEDCS